MVNIDEIAPPDSTPIRIKYYCTRCEQFFELSPIAPLRCPMCYTDARNIIGPIPAREVDVSKIRRRYKKVYR